MCPNACTLKPHEDAAVGKRGRKPGTKNKKRAVASADPEALVIVIDSDVEGEALEAGRSSSDGSDITGSSDSDSSSCSSDGSSSNSESSSDSSSSDQVASVSGMDGGNSLGQPSQDEGAQADAPSEADMDGRVRGPNAAKTQQILTKVMPVLKTIMQDPLWQGKPTRSQVREALIRVSQNGDRFWGKDSMFYTRRRTVEDVVLMFFLDDIDE